MFEREKPNFQKVSILHERFKIRRNCEALLAIFRLLRYLGRADRIRSSASNFIGDQRVKNGEKV